ncbi:HlyD family secretion protein [Paracoccus sulfuroxidans]|uniref:Membrane fusion protein n=1 Tax=Paracoccus sulfuroxidans TaxID=384678 RepID=A0A562NUY5_9RHOB|nr:HlyD family efflux transporter periplasmic adaptor subunit [Paracoccus sulfuroxidans]TWI36034.1 membrane fusion protein [Paracoccus sulfuroxidans]
MKHDPPPEVERREPLFRQQAVAYQARALEGDVLVRLSMRNHVLVVLAVVVVCAAVIFALKASYSRIEQVSGWVVPEAGLIRVTARQGGTIENLTVAEGDQVKAGQSLAVLRLSSDTDTGDAGDVIQTLLGAELEAARAQSEAERERLRAQQQNLTSQREAMRRELEASRGRITTMTERLRLVEANTERVKTIAGRGFASSKAVEEAEMGVLAARQELVDVRTGVMMLERQVEDIDAQLHAIPFSIRAAEAQARASEAALERQSTEVAVMNTYHAGATIEGKVVAVPVLRGQTLSPQSVIAVITPAGSSLHAELFVPSRSAGFIQPGQEVRLMYQAFPYQKFGTASGKVISVSRTVLGPTEISVPGLQIEEPVFRVKVALEAEAIEAYGQKIPIQPGMLLSAGIVIDRRSLFEWLLDPIYAVGRLG